MQLLPRWVREFAAGVNAGNAIRHGIPVRGDAVRYGVVPDAAGRRRIRRTPDAGRGVRTAPASLRRRRHHAPAPDAVAATTVPGRCRRMPASREGA